MKECSKVFRMTPGGHFLISGSWSDSPKNRFLGSFYDNDLECSLEKYSKILSINVTK
jgi:hypothetical protein